MNKLFFSSLLICFSTFCFSQIAEKDFEKAERLEHTLAEKIDSTKVLSVNTSLIYSRDSLFKCIHLKNADGNFIITNIEYLNDSGGYIEFKKESKKTITFEVRGDGADNPPVLMLVDKKTGKRKYLAENN